MAILSKIRTFLKAKIAPRLNSLAARLIAAAAVWTILGLVVGGFVLSDIFSDAVENNFDARLKFDLDGMIAAAEPDPAGGVSLRGRFTDPRFERVYSGWYWQITPAGAQPGQMQISRSLWDRRFTLTDAGSAGPNIAWGHGDGPDGQHLRIVAQRIEFPISATPRTRTTRAPIPSSSRAISRSSKARWRASIRMLFWSFAMLGLGLIGAIFIQVRVGLLPLAPRQPGARAHPRRARRAGSTDIFPPRSRRSRANSTASSNTAPKWSAARAPMSPISRIS